MSERRRRAGVSPELHAAVLDRDGRCFIARLDQAHVCRDQWGTAHAATDRERLTVDHVHRDGAVMGKRAPDDAAHLVALCAQVNIAGPSREVRQAERAYLAELYG